MSALEDVNEIFEPEGDNKMSKPEEMYDIFEPEEVEKKKEYNKLSDDEKTLEMHSEVENVNINCMLIGDSDEQISNNREHDNNICINRAASDCDCLNSDIVSTTSETTELECLDDQLTVLEPDNPMMMKFQHSLKQYLLKHRDNIKQELLTLEGVIRTKQNEKYSSTNDIKNVNDRVNTQHRLLSEYHKNKMKLKTANERVEACINQGKQRYAETVTNTALETKKFSVLKEQLDCSQGLLKELQKYEKEQEITFNMYNQKKSQTKQFKKKLLNEQQRQDLLLLSFTQEIVRLEDRMKELGEQAETKYNERELLRQKLMDSTTDLDIINEENAKISLLWNDVLVSIQQCDKSYQKIKKDFQEAKNKQLLLSTKASSYKRSVQQEFRRNEDLLSSLSKLKQEQNYLQNILKSYVSKFDNLKDEYAKLLQMTEFQNQNLDQVLFDQKILKNELNRLENLRHQTSNQILKCEEEIIEELKKQMFTNSHCIHINNKISELKNQSKEHELKSVMLENNLSQSLSKLEQYRTSYINLEQFIEKNNKDLDDQQSFLSALDSELKKLFAEIHSKSRQIDIENKHFEVIKNRNEKGSNITPQMKILNIEQNINEEEEKIDSVHRSWFDCQYKNKKLLDQRSKQYTELNILRKHYLILDSKVIKLEQISFSLSNEVDQNKRRLTNMRHIIVKLTEQFIHNQGKCSHLLDENEWIECSYFTELKENERQCLEYRDRLKILKNDLDELKNMYIEKVCESKSWDAKVKLLADMKKKIKKKEGDSGDIEALNNEIHRIQTKENQLKKILKKIMSDLDLCISRREKIYNTVATNNIRLKGKNEKKQIFLKKLDGQRKINKNIEIECKNLDRNISDCQHNKMELESKRSYFDDKLIHVQKEINELIIKIKEISATKIKNIRKLRYKQTHCKFLDEVNKGIYRLLIKNESKMNESFSAELKKNSDLISVLEALKNNFPEFNEQIICLSYILKSIDD